MVVRQQVTNTDKQTIKKVSMHIISKRCLRGLGSDSLKPPTQEFEEFNLEYDLKPLVVKAPPAPWTKIWI